MPATNGNGNGLRETLRFDVNVPVVAALVYDTPRPVQGLYGDQFRYTVQLPDGEERVLYLDPSVSEEVQKLGLRTGERFKIGKMELREGSRKKVEWRVRRLDPEEPAPQPREQIAAGPSSQPSAQPTAEPTQSTAPRPRTTLEDALCTVVSACYAAQEHAKTIGFQMPPADFENISKMAMTLIIEKRQNGGAR